MKQTNIEKVAEIFETYREKFEDAMNDGLTDMAYDYLFACKALLTASEIFEPDAVEVEQMQAAVDVMFKRRFW